MWTHSVVVILRNRSRHEDFTVSVVLRVDTVLYTGRVKEAVKKERSQHTVQAGTGMQVGCLVRHSHRVLVH